MTLPAICLAGAGVFVATLTIGRSALLWPSLAWAAACAGTAVAAALLWLLNSRLVPVQGPGARPWARLHAGGWPLLALLPCSAAAVAIYVDDASNYLATRYAPTTESLLAYAAFLLATAETIFLCQAIFRARAAPPGRPRRRAVAMGAPPVLLAASAAAYLTQSIYQRWLPVQIDLIVNLRAASDLLAGYVPYRTDVPVWNDRVHQLPTTLVFLFGPLSGLPEHVAALLFFFANQVCWLAGMWLLVRRLVPPGQRTLWLAAVLAMGATFWPWQESINFGQPDGLLILLLVLSLTWAAGGREVLAGIALGIVFPVKPISFWLPLAYLLHARWRAVAVAGLTAAGLVLVSLPLTSWEAWWRFLTVEVPAMLPGTVRGTNIPLPSLHARFFVGREALATGDPAPHYGAIVGMNLAANLLGLLLVAHVFTRHYDRSARAWLLDACLGLTLTLLLAPYPWQHYASWLTITFVVLAQPSVWRPMRPAAAVASGVLAGCAYLLLSLEDGQLVRFLEPLLERWPGALAIYPAGLLCATGAVLVARLAARPGQPVQEGESVSASPDDAGMTKVVCSAKSS